MYIQEYLRNLLTDDLATSTQGIRIYRNTYLIPIYRNTYLRRYSLLTDDLATSTQGTDDN